MSALTAVFVLAYTLTPIGLAAWLAHREASRGL